ncbi:MAG TPA: BTAD domain-containing putative transcriptional regulator [Streptosporangiaceae bacterium]
MAVDQGGSLWFEVLGPLRAYRGVPGGRSPGIAAWAAPGRRPPGLAERGYAAELALGWPRQRAVLAALVLRAGQVVSRDELIDAVWGADPPATAVNTLHAYITGLRKVLEPGRRIREPAQLLSSAGSAYVLRLAHGQLDLEAAERQIEEARRAKAAGDLRTAAIAMETAAGFWQGIPLGGVPGPLAEIERARLAELRLALLEEHAEMMLRIGAAADLTGDLASLVAEHPFREGLAGLLMRALYQAGRQAEALAVYQATRRTLAEELGIEPSLSLRRLHADILSNRDATDALKEGGEPEALELDTPHPEATVRSAAVLPRQLPAAPRHFTGRASELDTLTAMAREAVTEDAVVIAAIGGTAGVGKSSLAVQFAHQIADQFPDGQLYADLRGSGAAGSPAGPQEVIRWFLDAFMMDPARIPPDPRSQAALYRSVLAGKKVVLVLDNAGDEDQVRPLLPGSGCCLVMVTSRHRLTGLAAAHAATLLTLDVLTESEARELLGRRLGALRVFADPEAVGELARLSARLPLALSIAAARAASHPQLPLSSLAADLRDESDRLDRLDEGETAGMRSAFSWSYRALSRPAARIFRLLGIHPGPDVTVPAAASLTGLTPWQARGLLAELDREHLITEHLPGRFTFHDLLRAYASGQAVIEDSPAEREAAIQRMLDHYLHTARAAAVLLHPGREPPFPAPPIPGSVPEHLTSHQDALAWFEAEQRVLLAAVTFAAREGFDRHAWQLPWCLVTFLYRRGQWDQWVAVERVALAAARRLGDLAGQARAHLDLGYAGVVSGARRGTPVHLRQALSMFAQLDDREGQARAHNAMAGFLQHQRRYLEALRHGQLSLDLYLTTGNRAAHANALDEVAWLRAMQGDYEQAISDGQRALDLNRELRNRHGEGSSRDILGYAHYRAGRYATALRHFRAALTIRRELRDLQHEAGTLDHMGDTHHALGQEREARNAWDRALAILDDLHHPDAEQLRAKLGVTASNHRRDARA